MLPKTLVFIDVETGGLDPAVHGLTEVAAVAFTFDDAGGGQVLDSLSMIVAPTANLAYSPYALGLQGRTLEWLQENGSPEESVMQSLSEFLFTHLGDTDTRHGLIWAHNATFDQSFLRALEERTTGINALRYSREFPTRCDFSCTKTLFYCLRAFGVHDGKWSNLKEIAKQYGIAPSGNEHSALADARMGIECLAAMKREMDERKS